MIIISHIAKVPRSRMDDIIELPALCYNFYHLRADYVLLLKVFFMRFFNNNRTVRRLTG